MDREDLRNIRNMKLANDRHQDYVEKCRRERRVFLSIMIVIVLALGTILVTGGIQL